MYCALVQMVAAVHTLSETAVSAADSYCADVQDEATAQVRSLVLVALALSNSAGVSHTVRPVHTRLVMLVGAED
jgi:hypothetical protein